MMTTLHNIKSDSISNPNGHSEAIAKPPPPQSPFGKMGRPFDDIVNLNPHSEAIAISIAKPPPESPIGKMVSPFDIVNIPDDDDDDDIQFLYHHKKKSNVISVENRAITASLCIPSPKTPKRRVIDLTREYPVDDDDVKIMGSWTPSRKPRKIVEIGESSNSNSVDQIQSEKKFICEICVEPKSLNESFKIMGCTHSYCYDCMNQYVASKLQENVTQIQCPVPRCVGLLEPEHCRAILPPEVFDRWGSALCEAVILGSEKFYCPYKDCSALLIDDRANGEVIIQSECPNCYRLFCAECKVVWHSGIDCADYGKLNKNEREKEDIMLVRLAKEKKWMRCPKCKFYVERSDGCLYMLCRCKYAFCYNCGGKMGSSHFCQQCKH